MKHAESIQHIPNRVGPDVKFGVERYPAYPVQDDFVLINARVLPEANGYDVFLEWTLNDKEMELVKGKYISDYADKMYYYRFELGRFNEGDLIKYRIKVNNENDTVSTREFSFKVYNVYEAERLDSVEPVAGGIKLQFSGGDNYIFPSVYLSFENGNMKMSITAACDLNNDSSEVMFMQQDNAYIFQDKASGRKVVIDNNLFKIYIKDENDVTVLESYDSMIGFFSFIGSSDGQIHSLKLNFKVNNNDYFGFGEKFDRLNQKGLRPKSYVFNQPGKQGEKTYMPIPFFITERGYGMFVDTSYQVDFELAANREDLLEISARTNPNKPCLDLYVFFGQPKGIIKKYLGITGTPKLPPKWVFGPWISSNGWNTQKETLMQIDTMNKLKIPATVVVIEAWSDESTFYIFNDSIYKTAEGEETLKYKDFKYNNDGKWPDPKAMSDYIHKNNLKLVLWQIPVIKSKNYIVSVQHKSDKQYVIDNKLCVTYSDGTPYEINYDWFSNCMLPDFTNPETRKWWIKNRKYLVEDIGVDGFKTDGGEFVFDDDVVFYNGEDGAQMRNKYPQYYISTYHEFMNDDMITFSRAGSAGSQKYPIYWSGDQCSTFEEFRNVIRSNLSINISGNPFCGFDLGGYIHEIPTVELFIRESQFAVFSPVMQFHSETRPGENNDRSPWNIADRTGDERVIDIYRKFATIRMNIIPYIYNEARYVSQNCEPLMRPLFIDNPEDRNVFNIEFEYMFGRSLLVAPIIEEGIWQRSVYLPEGVWCDFWSGIEYVGNKYIKYLCDIDKIPVFIKKNSIIPLNLNNKFEIGGYIGNRVDIYSNLCFIVEGEVPEQYQFEDDLGNKIEFRNQNGNLSIDIKGNIEEIFIMFRTGSLLDEKSSNIEVNGISYCVYTIENKGGMSWTGKLKG